MRELARELDLGEAYAIAMAMERNASYVLPDERDGRRTAKRLGLNVTGILGIILIAKLDGSLPSLEETVEALRTRAGFWIASELEHRLLTSCGER